MQQALRALRPRFPELLLLTDVCLCEYTAHGHCGVLRDGEVDNDASLELLARTAVSHVEAGADVVCPSDMMDGRIAAIRAELPETPIVSYAAKYASAFYGPFREAAGSAPSFGDRRGYQMDPGNVREALRECELDVAEGADVLLVKPALPYLDVIRAVRERFDLPVGAYNVSGEYAMVKAAAAAGHLDERAAALESLTAIRRAGAEIVITYWAKELAVLALKHPRSELWHGAQKLIPGGVNSPVRAMRAVGLDEPFFVRRGEGAYIETADGRRLLDWVQSWGPLVFGHADPETVEAVREAALAGTSFGAPTEREVELAAEIVDAVPSIEQVRLVSSGTEAAMSALRLARAHTRRDRGDQVRRRLPRPRRSVPRRGRLRARDARHPRLARRSARRRRGDGRRRLQRRRPAPPPPSSGTARTSPRSSSSRSPGTWAASRRSPASSRRCGALRRLGRAARLRRGDHRLPRRRAAARRSATACGPT